MKIVDKKISPYEIHMEAGNYTVVEPTERTDKKGEVIYKIHGNYSSVENCLVKITKLLVEKDILYTLKGYIETLKEVKSNILNLK